MCQGVEKERRGVSRMAKQRWTGGEVRERKKAESPATLEALCLQRKRRREGWSEECPAGGESAEQSRLRAGEWDGMQTDKVDDEER